MIKGKNIIHQPNWLHHNVFIFLLVVMVVLFTYFQEQHQHRIITLINGQTFSCLSLFSHFISVSHSPYNIQFLQDFMVSMILKVLSIMESLIDIMRLIQNHRGTYSNQFIHLLAQSDTQCCDLSVMYLNMLGNSCSQNFWFNFV